MSSQAWFLYALRCADDTLYTGVTTDLARRVSEHNRGRGARYTSGRRPVRLIGAWPFEDRSAAQQAEAQFRRLPRRRKLQHVAQRKPVAGSAFHQDEAQGLLASVRFCPRCGSLLKTVHRPNDERPRRVCTVCGRIDYQNAKPCAGCLVVREGRLLLARRAIEPYLGTWDIPGGFLETDELPGAGAVREVEEETGLKVRVNELFGFYMDRYGHTDEAIPCLNIYFLGEVTGGTERPGPEVAELAWFGPEELPEEIAFDHAHRVLEEWATRMMGEEDEKRG